MSSFEIVAGQLPQQVERLFPHLATIEQVERHSINLTALLVEATKDSLGQSYFTEFTSKVLFWADDWTERLRMGMPLDKDTYHAVADLYAETFPA